jgi:hypothetical protein
MEKTLSIIIRDWVNANKKSFWKYEVSSYFKTYKISVSNLPKPSKEDITVGWNNRLLNDAQKIQLCNTIKKEYTKTVPLKKSSINVQVDYVKGAVIAAVI